MSAIAVIAGVGPGTGSALAHRFALNYPVALLARSKDSLDTLVSSIEAKGGSAFGYVTDVSDKQNMDETFKKISSDFQNPSIVAAVYNVGGSFKRGSFLEVSFDNFTNALKSNCHGAFLFAQHVIQNQVTALNQKNFQQTSPTLLFTGASASMKGGPSSSAFSAGKFGVRALSQSLAREFGPQGIHVSHIIMDGLIDIPASKNIVVSDHPDDKISPEAIAECYWNLHKQHRSCWTQELDLRPWVEKF